MFWLLSSLFWSYKNLRSEREIQLQLQNEKLITELKLLKSQIRPHFIFNALNNIYSLVQQGDANAALMLEKLSAILRYTVDYSSVAVVPLNKEVTAIEKYMALEFLKKPKSENIDFYQEGSFQNIQIVPLILLSLVENCFKHSNVNYSEKGWIKIDCIVEDNVLHFITANSKSNHPKEKSGIGNKNIERQLALNYPNQYELKLEETDEQFVVNLKIRF